MNQRKIQEVDDRLSYFYSEVELESVSMPIYNSLASGKTKYTDEVLIGEGGMKKVYSVYDPRTDRKVALAKPLDSLKNEDIEAFLKEARLTARLDHPNIIKVHEVGLDDEGIPFFTMDLKTGQSLNEYIKSKERTLQERLVIFLKICDAISYAHSKGVLHLDIKPDNIQIGEFGEVMICDWGLSVVHKNKSFKKDYDIGTELYSKASQNKLIKGTPGFMAPEQISNGELSERADVFSLGVILHYILTAEIPYSGNLEEMLLQTVSENLEAPSIKYPQLKLPVSLDAVILKALEIKAEKRYKNVQSLSNEIKAYMSGFTTVAENAGLSRKFLMLVKRNKTVFSILFFSLLLISALVFQYINDIKTEKQRVLEESKKVKSLNDQYVKDLTEQSLFISENFNVSVREIPFTKTLQLLNKVIETDPSALQPKIEKAQLLFIMQKFDEAMPLLQEVQSPLSEICQVALNRSKNNILRDEGMKKLIDKTLQLEGQEKIVNRLLFYDLKVKRRPRGTRLYFVQKVITHLNPDSKMSDISYDRRSQALTLSGKIKILEDENFTNPLRLLMPYIVILKDTEIDNIEYFTRLGIKELDIRGSRIKQLPEIVFPLQYFHKVTLREDQNREYKSIPTSLELIVK